MTIQEFFEKWKHEKFGNQKGHLISDSDAILFAEQYLKEKIKSIADEIIFTEDELKNSKEFRTWIKGRVAIIHNVYWDSAPSYQAYIVIHSDMGKWTITRFFKSNKKIQVSVDYNDISTEEVFSVLLTEYSRGLK